MFKKLLVRIIGKNIDEQFEKYNISKAKVASMLTAILIGVNVAYSQYSGLPLDWFETTKDFLGSFGLWALRDGIK